MTREQSYRARGRGAPSGRKTKVTPADLERLRREFAHLSKEDIVRAVRAARDE